MPRDSGCAPPKSPSPRDVGHAWWRSRASAQCTSWQLPYLHQRRAELSRDHQAVRSSTALGHPHQAAPVSRAIALLRVAAMLTRHTSARAFRAGWQCWDAPPGSGGVGPSLGAGGGGERCRAGCTGCTPRRRCARLLAGRARDPRSPGATADSPAPYFAPICGPSHREPTSHSWTDTSPRPVSPSVRLLAIAIAQISETAGERIAPRRKCHLDPRQAPLRRAAFREAARRHSSANGW